MAINQDERDEKLGRAILTLNWWIFAVKFLIIVTVIAGIVIYFLGKPLWIAPMIAIGVFIIYRLIWRPIWVFIGWAGRQ